MVPPTEAQVRRVASNLRESDAYEVRSSDGIEPAQVVLESWAASTPTTRRRDRESWIIEEDGEALGVCGVASGGLIWLLCTDGLLATPARRRQFIREGRPWVDACLARYGALYNRVLAKNVDSIRWLEQLGFTVYPPIPYGPSCELFSYFERRARPC